MDDPVLHPATRVVHLGRPAREPGNPVGPPIVLTSTYAADGPVDYARVGNPTWTELEQVVGDLEGGRALAFASGMAALAAVFSLVPRGGTVVLPRHAYSGTGWLLDDLEALGDLTVRRVDVTDPAEIEAALPGASLLHLESPTNPMLEVVDLARAAEAAHRAGALLSVDNTFATPLLQQPLALGADVVVHSVTKLLSGHSDLVLGAVVLPDEAGRERFERVHRHRSSRGAIPGPVEAWLALRGLRTLEVRLERAQANAATLAARLEGHPGVLEVRYPGWGAMIAVRVRGGADGAERVAATTRVWVHATSLGGVDSQLERRRRHPLEPATVPEDLLRLSVGIEHVEDLWRDLSAALDTVAGEA